MQKNIMDKLKGKKALVVDDEELIREIFQRELEDIGVLVEEAKNGTEAFEKIRNSHYDFVISDVRMPGGSGKELLISLADSKLDTFIVMVTGFSDLDSKEAMALGAKAIFEKPFKIENIFQYIAQEIT